MRQGGTKTMDVSFIRYVVKAGARYAVLFSPLQHVETCTHSKTLQPNNRKYRKYMHSFQTLKHIFPNRTKKPNHPHTHTSCVKCVVQKDGSITPHIDSSNGASSPLTGDLLITNQPTQADPGFTPTQAPGELNTLTVALQQSEVGQDAPY